MCWSTYVCCQSYWPHSVWVVSHLLYCPDCLLTTNFSLYIIHRDVRCLHYLTHLLACKDKHAHVCEEGRRHRMSGVFFYTFSTPSFLYFKFIQIISDNNSSFKSLHCDLHLWLIILHLNAPEKKRQMVFRVLQSEKLRVYFEGNNARAEVWWTGCFVCKPLTQWFRNASFCLKLQL